MDFSNPIAADPIDGPALTDTVNEAGVDERGDPDREEPERRDDALIIGERRYQSRLLVGTGKYKSLEVTRLAIEASGAEIVTVAIRRTNIGQRDDEPSLLDYIDPKRYTILPNTAGCFDAESAIRTCQLSRELLDGEGLVKLEVLGEKRNLYPNTAETVSAASRLIDDGFQVMVYTNDDPIVAKELEDAGCIAIMPLAAPIGSGLGICNEWSLCEIINTIKAPVLVDAGVGTASDATIAMELGCDGVLMNTAIALANEPLIMAAAMKLGVEAGRAAFLAGRMPKKGQARASSPLEGISR